MRETCSWCGGSGTAEAERNLLLARALDRGNRDSSQWIGCSSDAMVVAAINGTPPAEQPFDGWDLGRCMVTRAVAPECLHKRMDAILDDWIDAMEHEEAETGHPFYGVECARGMLAKYEQVVRSRIWGVT